jgi:hypothetical protein
MEKLARPVSLSPEAVEVLRRLIYGTNTDKSPSIREVQIALDDNGCSEADRNDVLLVLGLEGEHHHSPKATWPPIGRR